MTRHLPLVVCTLFAIASMASSTFAVGEVAPAESVQKSGLGAALTSPATSPAASSLLPRIQALRTYGVQRLDVPVGIPEQVEIKVNIEGKLETLRLFRTSLRSATSKLLLDRGEGKLESSPLPPHRTYRGTVASNGALVAASIIDGRLSALIDMPSETFFVQPMSEFATGRGANEHAVYRHSDALPFGDHHCGNDDVKLTPPDWMLDLPTDPAQGGSVARGVDGGGDGGGDGGSDGGGDGGIAGTTPFISDIACDADFEFFQLNGSNATSVVNDIENVLNNVSLLYDRDVNISYEVTTIVVRTTAADPYTTTVMNDLLCEFRNKWNTSPENEIQRDVAQLFTGKQITGNVIGLAWLGVVCNQAGNDCGAVGNLAYSCVESRFTNIADFRTSLSAHELGHNWQAGHCDAVNPCNVMCSIINSCQGTAGANLKFSPTEQAQITAYRNAVSCDVALPPAIALPFSDGFDASATINSNNWIYSKGAVVTTSAIGEPSPTRSINLDAISALAYGDDEIRTNYMLLAGLPTVIVRYSTQHIGVEVGKQLIVEYLSSTLRWALLNTINSDGVNQTTFSNWLHTMPANAKHNKFRLRFRAAVDAQDDDWFIDDVSVVTVIIPDNDECVNATAIGEGAFAFNSANATDSATTLPASCDEGAGTLMKNDLWYLYTPSCTGTATVTTCNGAAFDTRLAAYRSACAPAGTLVACDDATAGCANGTSRISFTALAGTGYYLRVGGATGGGTGTLTTSCVATQPCDADLNLDGLVDASDLAEVLNGWGTTIADINGDGTTDGADLAVLLNAWGDCPV